MATGDNMNGATGHVSDEPSHPEENRQTTTRKLIIALITFIPAFILLSIINHAVTEILVTPPFDTRPSDIQPSSRAADGESQETQTLPPKIVTKTVYVPPSDADLARLRQEIEASDPLPPADNADAGSSNRVVSAVSSLKSVVGKRNEKLTLLAKESANLKNAHESFIQRFDEDISLATASTNDKNRIATVLNQKLASLQSILSLSELSTVDREALATMFRSAGSDLNELLTSTDKKLFINDDGVLLEALVNGSSPHHNSSECSPSFLLLDGKNVSSEFSILPGAKMKSNAKNKVALVPVGTARESDLYQSVEGIKNILSRRDVNPLEVDANGSLHSPLSQIGTDTIRRQISDTALALKLQRQDHAYQQTELRTQWMSKVESNMPIIAPRFDDGDICANSNLVEHMVASGLESLRKKSDLQSAVRVSLFSAIVNESKDKNADAEKIKFLTHAMKDSYPPKIDYEKKQFPSPPSSKKFRRKSLFYLVDSPLLHIGLARWMNYFVDVISGYNDNIDSLLDWIIGDSGSTFGEIAVDVILRMARLIPYHDEFAKKFKAAGILAGRTRSVLEE
ncbi:hypothetical protein HJC23_007310 [Cyclotella cryptica]|uniref:Uncharacterized protein n=1 Tax=Cyclotella cryptica TaxID=29204 RepID=A0ABD3NXT5_9STRA|eukprot:CCRYP_019304-RA/>CCRYP_019304-RA protein AED:0.02 eAED:0.02 QI:0/-1/0/1/-1/1/1/0/568